MEPVEICIKSLATHPCLPGPFHSVHCVHSLTRGAQSVLYTSFLKTSNALLLWTILQRVMELWICSIPSNVFFQIRTSREQNFTKKSSSHSFTLKWNKVFVECIIFEPFRSCHNSQSGTEIHTLIPLLDTKFQPRTLKRSHLKSLPRHISISRWNTSIFYITNFISCLLFTNSRFWQIAREVVPHPLTVQMHASAVFRWWWVWLSVVPVKDQSLVLWLWLIVDSVVVMVFCQWIR